LLHSRRRELYTLQRERETAEEAELRRARRREHDRHSRQTETPEQAEIRRATGKGYCFVLVLH